MKKAFVAFSAIAIVLIAASYFSVVSKQADQQPVGYSSVQVADQQPVGYSVVTTV